jgi:hypothetical protein
MPTIIQGQPADFTVTIQRDGAPLAISLASVVTARLFAGATPLTAAVTLSAVPSWTSGQVPVSFSNVVTGDLPTGAATLAITSTSPAIIKRFAVTIESATEFASTGLFVRDIAVDAMRADRLVVAASGAMPSVTLADDYLWAKLRAAESEIAHELRVPLVPTAFFPATPTNDEITALNGMPWAIDPGYDYEPASFSAGDKWGLIKLRNKPIQSVSRVRFAYPGGAGSYYDLPLDWLRMDRKYGTVQFVPSSTAFIAPLNAFVMQAIGNGRTIPLAIQVSYVAGLVNVAQDYPELLDVIMKKASLKIIEDAFLPQSGSISADGLSQSMSNDMDKHHDTIDRVLNGGKGSNGGLMAAIHGIRLGVM